MVSRNRQAGFTLIEMMVVVVVIALLGSMIGPTLFKKVQQAERTRIAQDIRVIEGALKFYRLDNYRYPQQSQGLDALMTNPGGADNWNGPYLEKLRLDWISWPHHCPPKKQQATYNLVQFLEPEGVFLRSEGNMSPL